jgi:hypothetical protein
VGVRFQLRSRVPGRLRAVLSASLTLMAVAGAVPAAAQDATWVGGTPPGPAASNYGATANWNPATVPSGTATFGASANTDISIGSAYNVGGWTFGPGASAYTFAIDIPGQFIFTGAGINIGGGSASITNNFSLWFFGSSTAGERQHHQHGRSAILQ